VRIGERNTVRIVDKVEFRFELKGGFEFFAALGETLFLLVIDPLLLKRDSQTIVNFCAILVSGGNG